jgi:Mg-chelatase subunit ChlD
MTERRSIAGVVSIWEPRLSERVVPAVQHIPVDVVNVLDISGSMNDRWGPGQEVKLSTAKAVLTEFNNYLMPAEGDRVGLVTFPTISTGAWYGLACTGSWHRYYYRGYVRSQLTIDVQAVNNIIQMLSANGGTPIASAMQLARAVALPDGEPTPGRVPVIILASDGLANCTVDGRWTGFDGMTYDPPPCNGLAEQQALEQANIAKQAGIIVFTIAMGDSFNSDLLRAMATADTDPSKPHFFVANTGQDLRAIYLSLAQRINNIGGECNVEEFESSGEYARVSLYKDGELYATTTASATGSYVFTDVEPGTYSFAVTMQKNGLTFDVLTKLIGGPPAEEPITITVGQGVGTYVKDLYLRTSTPLQCR